jgi:membrane-associated phospholipid phosphatase
MTADDLAHRSVLGEIGYYGPITLFAVLLVMVLKVHEYWAIPWLVLWQVANYYVNVVLKNYFQYARPSGPLPTPAMGYLEKHKYYGFPSGHAQGVVSLGVFMLLWLNFKSVWPLADVLLGGCIVAQMLVTLWQRVAYVRHTVAQVVAGSLVGALCGAGFFYGLMYICVLRKH